MTRFPRSPLARRECCTDRDRPDGEFHRWAEVLHPVPILVIHRRDYQFLPLSHGEYIAEHIPGPSSWWCRGRWPPLLGTPNVFLHHVERFVAGRERSGGVERRLLTRLFTDIFESTRQAGRLGDCDWSTVLDLRYEISY